MSEMVAAWVEGCAVRQLFAVRTAIVPRLTNMRVQLVYARVVVEVNVYPGPCGVYAEQGGLDIAAHAV